MLNFECDDPSDDENQVERDHHLPWTEKYRPIELSKIISHDHIIHCIEEFMELKTMPNLLLYGPSGTGKTSTAISCGRKLYGDKYNFMVLELNTSDSRGIETVRQKIKTFVHRTNQYFIPLKDQNIFKLVILDETDAMTQDAQAILRQIMEINNNTTRFFLICNYINKINPALQSRCCRFRFKPLTKEKIFKRLEEISTLEKLKFEPSSLYTIIDVTGGDMRKAINLLQTTSLTYDVITSKYVYMCAGYCQPEKLDKIYHELSNIKTINKTFQKIKNIFSNDKYSMYNLIYKIKDILIADDNLTDDQKMNIVVELSQLEIQIAIKVDDLKLLNLVSIFIIHKFIK